MLETPAWLVSRWQIHSPAGCCRPAHFERCWCGSGWSNGHWGGWHRPRGHQGGLGWLGVAALAHRGGLVVLWSLNAFISVTRILAESARWFFLISGLLMSSRRTNADIQRELRENEQQQQALRELQNEQRLSLERRTKPMQSTWAVPI